MSISRLVTCPEPNPSTLIPEKYVFIFVNTTHQGKGACGRYEKENAMWQVACVIICDDIHGERSPAAALTKTWQISCSELLTISKQKRAQPNHVFKMERDQTWRIQFVIVKKGTAAVALKRKRTMKAYAGTKDSCANGWEVLICDRAV